MALKSTIFKADVAVADIDRGYYRDHALRIAFPDAERIEDQTYVLTDAQAERVVDLSQSPLDSKLVKIYTA